MAIQTLIANFPRATQGDGGGDLATYTKTSTFTRDNIDVTLSATAQVGDFDNGFVNDVWVRPIGGASTVTVSSYSPGFTTSPRALNGAMLNIESGQFRASGDIQGFGEYDTSLGTPEGSQYDAAVNAATGTMELSPGDCLIIAESVETVSDKNRQYQRFIFIHCVADIPYADEFAPPIVWHSTLGAKPRKRYSEIDESSIPTLPTSGFSNSRPTSASLLTSEQTRRPLDHHQNAGSTFDGGNGRKTFRTELGPSLYGRDIQQQIDAMYSFILSDAPISDRRPVIKHLVQRGIDNYGTLKSAVAAGHDYLPPDGGHQAGRLMPIIIAGGLLGDAAIRDAVKDNFTPMNGDSNSPAEYGMRAYMTSTVVDATQVTDWKGAGADSSDPHVPYEGACAVSPAMPEWCGKAEAEDGTPGLSEDRVNNTWDGPSNFYRNTGQAEGAAGQTAAILALGLRTALDHDALIDYHARQHAIQFYGDDPWRYTGSSGTARYDLINNAPTTKNPDTFADEFYDTHIFKSSTYYEFPAGVNDFNGAT